MLEHEPDWQALPAETPAKVRDLLRQCLHKDANRRLNSIGHARMVIEEVQHRSRFSAIARQPRFAVAAAALLLLLGYLGVRLYQHDSRVRWVREQATPEISRLLESGDLRAAFRLMRRAEAILPDDSTLKRIHHNSSFETPFSTNPPGAEVWATGYAPDDNDWLRLGTTPFTTKELLWGLYRFRIVKPGFRTILATGEVRGGTSLNFDLDAEGAIPPEMVRVPAGIAGIPGLDAVKLSAFLIDRYEITNRQFKEVHRSRRIPASGSTGNRTLSETAAASPGKRPCSCFAIPRAGRALPHGNSGEYPQGSRRLSGERRELVRGRGLRGICGKTIADHIPLAAGRESGLLRGYHRA